MSMMMMDEKPPVLPMRAACPPMREALAPANAPALAPVPMSVRYDRTEEASQVMDKYGSVRSALKKGAKRVFSGLKTPRKAASDYIDIVNTTLGRLPEASRSQENDIKMALDAFETLEVPAADTTSTKAKLAIMLIVGEWMRNGNTNSIDCIDEQINMYGPLSQADEILL